MNLWICPACQTANNASLVCQLCGFDERNNLSRYPSVFRLSSRQKQHYTYTLYDAESSVKKADAFLENQDYASARAWYLSAANKGHSRAQRMLGDYYSSVGDDETQAIYWYKQAAASGDPQAQYELAVYYSSSDETDLLKQAYDLYEHSANAGFAKSQYIMGELNCGEEAAFWYQKAADQDYAKALCELADDQKYYNENSYPEDETFALYLKAATLGAGRAQREVWNHYLQEQEYPVFHSVLEKNDESRWYHTAFEHHEWIMKEVFFHFLLQTDISEQKQKCLNKLKEDEVLSWPNTDSEILAQLKHLIQNAQYEKLMQFLASEDSMLAQVLRHYYTCKGLGVEQNFHFSGTTFMIMADGLFGDGITYAEAIEKYAVWGCHDLQFDLGYCYAHGFGVPVDTEKAAYWYQKAESWNPAAVWRELGILYANIKDYKTALSFYQKAADSNDPEACFRLGKYFRPYHINNIYHQDVTHMFQYFEKAAMLGHPQAQSLLGTCFDAGLGTIHDTEKAVYWYKKAAAQWDAIGLTRLGICLEKGCGIAKNVKEAVLCYQKAADQMDGYACYQLAKCYETGNGTECHPALSKEYLERSQKLGNAMSTLYDIATSVPYSRVLNSICTVMENFYGYITDEVLLLTIAETCFNEKEYADAAVWYHRLISAGYISSDTYFHLGECFFQREKHYSHAMYWYKKAGDHAAAHRQIGIMYKHGYGVSPDKKEAKKWLKSAVKLGDYEAVKHLLF